MRLNVISASAFLTALAVSASVWADPLVGIWEQTNDEGKPIAWIQISEQNHKFSGRYVKTFPGFEKEWKSDCSKCTESFKDVTPLGFSPISEMTKNQYFDYYDGRMTDIRDGITDNLKLRFRGNNNEFFYYAYIVPFGTIQIQSMKRVPETVIKDAHVPENLPVK